MTENNQPWWRKVLPKRRRTVRVVRWSADGDDILIQGYSVAEVERILARIERADGRWVIHEEEQP